MPTRWRSCCPVRILGLTTTGVAVHTAPMIDDGRLPGGIRVARAWWLVRRPRRVRVGMIAAVLFYGFYLVLILTFLRSLGAIPMTGGVVALVVLIAIIFRGKAPGVLVTPDSQPGLYDLVSQTAWRIGVAVPAKVWLTGRPTVYLRPRHRPELLIGWPLVISLPAAQLGPVIAHELALLQFGRAPLVIRLLDLWRSQVEDTIADEPVPPRIASVLAELDPFASVVETATDAAAVNVSDRTTAAAALVAADNIGHAYLIYTAESAWFVLRTGTTAVMRDVADGWRRLLAAGHTAGLVFQDELARRHPGLAAAILDIPDPDPTLPPEAMAVAALRPREIRRLAAQTVMTDRIRWYTFAKAPAKLWLRRARGDLRRARSSARRVLGRDPHNDAETMRVLAERPAEVAAVSLSVDPAKILAETTQEALAEMRTKPSWALVQAAEYFLLERDWHLEHPALRGVLIDPDGVRHSLPDGTSDEVLDLLGFHAADADQRSDRPASA
jgi:hypothetical protein